MYKYSTHIGYIIYSPYDIDCIIYDTDNGKVFTNNNNRLLQLSQTLCNLEQY